jgi:uncharacterized protein
MPRIAGSSFFSKREVSPEGMADRTVNGLQSTIPNERIFIMDAVRGIAVLGILVVNINWFGEAFQYNMNLNLRNEYGGPNYYTWFVTNVFFEGSFRALFCLLFGASTILLLKKAERKGIKLSPADYYYRRLIWLLVFGLINAYVFLWPADILYSYALCGFFLFPFRNFRPRHLLIIGLIALMVSGIKGTHKMYLERNLRNRGVSALLLEKNSGTLGMEQQSDKKAWLQYKEQNSTSNLQALADSQNKVLHEKYSHISQYYHELTERFETIQFYLYDFWDIIGFFFIGMAFFGWKILVGEKSRRYYWTMMWLGYGAGLTLGWLLIHARVQTRFDETKMADWLKVDFYQEKRLFMSIGHIGLVILIYKYGLARRLFQIFSKVGQMTLSNYLLQSLICSLIFYGFGFGLFGRLQRYELYYVVVFVWIFQIVLSMVWLKFFRFGPFEWLWKCLTYWEIQPLRRERKMAPPSTHTHPGTGTLGSS